MPQRKILLVEDSPDDRDLILRVFEKQMLSEQVVTVSDGVEALDYLFGAGAYAGRNHTRLPAVMLLDLKLPRLNASTCSGTCAKTRAHASCPS